MSLPKSAATKAARRVKPADSAAKSRASAKLLKGSPVATGLPRAKTHAVAVEKTAPKRDLTPHTIDAVELAKELERGLAEGRLDVLPPPALQALMAALCKTYSANNEAGNAFPIVGNRSAVTSTDVMLTCAALLKAADLQVFELGMWQSWTGR